VGGGLALELFNLSVPFLVPFLFFSYKKLNGLI
jgi:hypothetical protein